MCDKKLEEKARDVAAGYVINQGVNALAGGAVPGAGAAIVGHVKAPILAAQGKGVAAGKAAAGMFGGLSGAIIGFAVGGPVGAVVGGVIGSTGAAEGAGAIFKATGVEDDK